jgi:hypothetical protein
MTSNLSKEEIKALLDRETKKDENIQTTSTIGQSAEYLDVSVKNKDGQLKTSVYHKSAVETYILPYQSYHPRHIHRNNSYVTLLRAARLCSNVEDFDVERLNMEMVLLLNGYPPKFISYYIKHFFPMNHAMSVWNELDSEAYQKRYQQLLYKPTRRENEENK